MSVKIRTLKRGGFEVDIHVTLPDGKHQRERVASPFPNSKTLSREWGERRYTQLALGMRVLFQQEGVIPLPTTWVSQLQTRHVGKPSDTPI